MINTVVTSTVTPNSRPRSYPYIGEYKAENGIVLILFSSERTGITIYVTDSLAPYGVGHYADDWVEDKFRLFKGSITLKNEF